MRIQPVFYFSVLLLVLMLPFASANVVTTTMTWVVASVKTVSVAYGSPCVQNSIFFVETNAQHDPDSDGNAARIVPSNRAADTNCQSSTQAVAVVTSSGTATINVDGNFSAAFTGADINIVLKAWQGSSGCGTHGLGGWEKDCSVGATTAPGTTTCTQWNGYTFAATAGRRLVTSLAALSSQQICLAGDMNFFVSSGDHNGTFQWGSEFS